MKKILNIGIQKTYDKNLIRKIRISNLVALISLIVMLSYIPLSLVLDKIPGLLLILFFASCSLINFVLHSYYKHSAAFLFFTFAGFIYFYFATLLFGLTSNIHYYFLVMCMICAVIFDKKWVINGFIFLATSCFFSLVLIMENKQGYLIDTPELIAISVVVGYVVVILLFIIASIFFLFLKSENYKYQQEIITQKEIIEEKHKEITDSINYAERIQRSFLATKDLLDQNLTDYFVFFQPKDIVSGDFYWAAKLQNDNFAFCCADSTGHGVPGAIMSILNISSLEKSIEKEVEADKILNETRKIIIDRLKKDGSIEGGKDGMDCSLVVLSADRKKLSLSAAHNPVFIVSKTENDANYQLQEFQGDKMPVGKHQNDHIPFTCKTIDLNKGDMIYLITDGFVDQFGGEKSKKYMVKNLKAFLTKMAALSAKEQEKTLAHEFETWKGNNEQIDDVCIVGFRV